MFQYIAKKISTIFEKKKPVDNRDSTILELRNTFLGADLSLEATEHIISQLNEKWHANLKKEEIQNILQQSIESLFEKNSFSVIDGNYFFTGLQGSGKTTSVAKLALFLKNKNKKVLVVSLDTYRHAAFEQTANLCKTIGVDFLKTNYNNPYDIATEAIKVEGYDIKLFDTTGSDSDEQIAVLKNLISMIKPVMNIIVVNALSGKQVINIIQKFQSIAGPNLGFFISSCDTEDRGGLMLSISYGTKLPVFFIGTGEKPQDIDLFNEKTISKMVIGSFNWAKIKEFAEQSMSPEEEMTMEKKITSGNLDFNDISLFIDKSQSMLEPLLRFSGSVGHSLGENKEKIKNTLQTMKFVIDSMNPKERQNPSLLEKYGPRYARISKGANVPISTVAETKKFLDTIKNLSKILNNPGVIEKFESGDFSMDAIKNLTNSAKNPMNFWQKEKK